MRVLIRGKVWQLVEHSRLPNDRNGDCDPPGKKGKQIRVRRGLAGRPLLDTLVHELIHAALWDLGEGPVASLANEVARALWKRGVRASRRATHATQEHLEHEVVSIIWTRGEVAVIDEDVRREVAHAIARLLTRLGWRHTSGQ